MSDRKKEEEEEEREQEEDGADGRKENEGIKMGREERTSNMH